MIGRPGRCNGDRYWAVSLLRDLNEVAMDRLPFGKHRGQSLGVVLMADQGYCKWLLNQTWFAEQYPKLRSALASMMAGDRVVADELQSTHTIAEPPPRRRSSRRKGHQPLAEAIQASVALLAPPELLDGGCVVLRPRAFAQRAQ